MSTSADRYRFRARPWLLSVVLVATAFIAPASAQATGHVVTLDATLGANGDPAGGGTVALTLNQDTNRACFTADAVTLTDFTGDPPTFVGINDTRLTINVTKIWFPASFDGAGDDEGCTTITAARMDDIVDHATDYAAVIYTAGYGDLAAAGGRLAYSYPTASVDVTTRLCPYAIRNEATLAGNEAQCDPIVIPAHDVAGDHPGYTDTDYGGVKAFDLLVTDSMSLDATIADARREGVSGACDAGTLVCDWDGLRYRFANAAQGPVAIKPTLPTGTRLGPVVADVPSSVSSGTINLDLSAGNAAVTMYLFYLADTTAPTVKTPVARFITGATYGPGAPVRVSWSGSDGGTGIHHYTVQRRVGSGAYATIADGGAATSITSSFARGSAHRFRVRAVDIAGNVSAWVYSASSELLVVQDTSSRVRYGGTWRTQSVASASGGKLHYASIAGRTARLTFTGRAVTWIAPSASARGKAKVYIDGALVATVDLKGTAAPRIQQFSRTWSKVGTHTITIKVVGTAGRPRVDIDAFAYLR